MSALLSRFAAVRPSVQVQDDPPQTAMIRTTTEARAAVFAGRDPAADLSAVLSTPPVQVIRPTIVQRVDSIPRLDPSQTRGGSGDSIRAAQSDQSAAADGFASVNREWYRKTLTYDAARDVMASDRGECMDIIAPRSRFTPIVGTDGAFAVLDSETGGTYRPTENALQQLAGWTETGLTLPKRLVAGDDDDKETLRAVMANGWRKIEPDKNLLLRLRSDGTLRAILSDGYRRVDNSWFLDVLESILPGGRVSHLRGDGDAWFFNLLIPDSMRADGSDQYGAMLACGNSEIGTRTLGTLPSIFRWICYNGNIWDCVEGVAYVRQVHRGQWSLDDLAAEIRANLDRQIPLLPMGIDRLLGLRSIQAPRGLPDLSVIGTVLDQIATAQITRPMAAAIVDGFKDQRTEAGFVSAFDLVNGITKAAQGFAPSVQESVERAAGELTAGWDAGRWDAAFRAARSFKESDAKRVFTLDVAAQLSA